MISKLVQQLKKQVSATANVVVDSRELKPGDVFLAYPGFGADGREYIGDAVAKSAAAIVYESEGGFSLPSVKVPTFAVPELSQQVATLAEQFYEYPAQGLTLFGVTGTNGKTSVTQLLAQALAALKKPCGVLGTLGNGIWPDLQPSLLTTQEPCALQKWLRIFKQQHCDTVAMEVSSHALAQNRLGSTQLNVGIFTNLSQDHLDYHGTMQAYGLAKARLFEQHVSELALLNADDVQMPIMRAQCSKKVDIKTFGINQPADIYLRQSTVVSGGFAIVVDTPWGVIKTTVHLVGAFNLSNILAVIGVLGHLKYSVADIAHALQQCQGVPGRMEQIHQQPQVIIDYSHKPEALQNALQAARVHCQGKLYVVFGCGGDRDRGKRSMMAAIAEQYADCVMVTEDNPRTEDPKQIFADIMKGFAKPEVVLLEPDRECAIQTVLRLARSGDTVLLAGKGHECYIIRGNTKVPFREVEVVQNFYRSQKTC